MLLHAVISMIAFILILYRKEYNDIGSISSCVGIITKIENGRLYYDAHTTDRNMAEVNFAGDKSIVIIHIKEEAE